MRKFTVIIPTIWKGPFIIDLLERYYRCSSVEEVILIDNDINSRPVNLPFNEKLKLIETPENIYVNPAWNLGVSLSTSNYITISNDDILFDVDDYFNFLNSLNDPFEQWGFIGTSSDNYGEPQPPIRLQSYGSHNKGGWACLFSFYKSIWRDIPEGIKIYYGDNFIHLSPHPINEMIGIPIWTKMSSSADTSVDWVKEITDNDHKEWFKVLTNIYNNE